MVINLANHDKSNTFAKFLLSCPATKISLSDASKRTNVNAYLKKYKKYINKVGPIRFYDSTSWHPYKKGRKGGTTIYTTISRDGKAHHVIAFGPNEIDNVDDALINFVKGFQGPKFPKQLKAKNLVMQIKVSYVTGSNKSFSFKVDKIGTDNSYWKITNNK